MKFASFDPGVAAPQPVLGWYDTDALAYPNLPPEEARCALTDAEWEARMNGHWAVQDGALVVAPVALADVKAAAKAAARAALGARIAAGMPWAGKVLQIDETSQARMTASVLLAQQGLPPAAWRMADNSALPLDPTGLLDMATAAGSRVTALRAHYWDLVDLITAAANAASVASINTTTGWPGEG